MAGEFIDPTVQANLDRLLAALRADEARLGQVLAEAQQSVVGLDAVSSQAVAAQAEEARLLVSGRVPIQSLQETIAALGEINALIERQIQLQSTATGAERARAAAAGETRAAAARTPAAPAATQAAVKEQVSLEADTNALIVRQIELQAQAAAAARQVAVETEGIVGAAERVQAATVSSEVAAAQASLHPVQRGPLAPGAPGTPGTYDSAALAAKVEAQAQAARAQAVLSSPVAVAAGSAGPDAQATTAGLTARQQALYESAILGANGESKLGAAVQQSILYYTQGDNALQRHGALTTDFINAAARGEVTLREFGDQIGQTIGKFAGWTGAAAAVYGAFAAVTSLSRGAIDASTTVQQLHRTIDGLSNQTATQAVIQVAHDTNTSMKEAGDAVFQFSRTFPNLSDATYAAGLALKAFQLDGVSVADQVKAQTAIHQQFGISAQGLGPIYDELAAGQREYNARITDQIPLLQRSASAVKNAGGDLQTFIELSTVALRTTQLSGSQLGTAFLRSASTFLNPATAKGQADRQVLASLGIDPNQNYTSLIVDALKRAATLSNAQREQLSLAVFGPLLGGRTAGFFTGGADLIGPVQKSLAPGAVKGTFLEEFAKELGTSQQQLKALGNNLQQLGAELGSSGLGAPIGLLVKGLNEALTISTQLLAVFSGLPAPVREAAGFAAALYAARAVSQRAGLTGVPFLGQSQETQARAQINTGLRAEQDFYQQQYASTARNAATAGITAQVAERARNEAVAAGDETRIIASQQVYLAAVNRELELKAQTVALQEQTVVLQERNAAYQAALNAGLSAEAAAQSVGVDYRLLTVARGVPVANPVVPVGTAAADAAAVAARRPGLTTAVYGGAPGENLALGSTTPGVLTGSAAADAAALEQQAAVAAAELPLYARAMTGVRGSIGRVTDAIPGASSAIGAAGSALRSSSSGISGLVSSLGGFIPVLFGVGLAYGELSSGAQHLQDLAQQTTDALNQKPNTVAELGQKAQHLAQLAQQQKAAAPKGGTSGFFGGVIGALSDARNFIAQNLQFGPGAGTTAPSGTPIPGGVGDLQAAGARELAGIATQQKSLRDVYAGLAESVQDAGKLGATTSAGRQQFEHALDAAAAAAKAATPKTPLGEQAIKAFFGTLHAISASFDQTLQLIAVNSKDPFAQFKGRDPKNIVQSIQASADRVKLYGAGNGSDINSLAVAYEYLAKKFAGSNDDKSLQLVVQAQGYFVDAVKKAAQDLVDSADVSTGARKTALLAQARAVLDLGRSRLAAIGNSTAVEGRAVAHSEVAMAETIARVATGITGLADGILSGLGLINVSAATIKARTDAANKALASQVAQINAQAKSSQSAIDHANSQVLSQLDQTLKGINTASKVPKTAAGSDPFELTRLQRELEQARAKGDAVKVAQIGEELANQEIAAAKNERERLQGQIDLANAEYQYDQAIQARTQARFTFLGSETTDPVKQAAIALKAATEGVANAVTNSGSGSADYYTAKAKQNDAKHKLADAHLTQSEDNIQFNLDVQNIGAQTAINEYNNLLKLRDLTKQQRQDLLRKIYDLQKGTSNAFGDLNLGTITLPTPYQIRRAVLGAQQQGSTFITNNNSVTIPVTDGRATGVGAVMDRYVSGTGKALERARGTRRG